MGGDVCRWVAAVRGEVVCECWGSNFSGRCTLSGSALSRHHQMLCNWPITGYWFLLSIRRVLGSLCDAATLLRVTAERAALATLMEAAGTGVTAEPSTSPAAAAAQQVVGATQGPPAAASPAAMAQGQNSAGRRQEGEEGEAVLAMPGCAVACLATLSTGPQEGSGTTHGAAQIGECENSSSGSGSSDARRGPTVRLVLQSLVAQEEGSRLHRRCSTVSVPCAHGLASPEALHAAAALGRAEGTQLLALARSEGWVP